MVPISSSYIGLFPAKCSKKMGAHHTGDWPAGPPTAFRYTNNNVTTDRCSIPLDMTVMLGFLKLSLWATIDHPGPPLHSGHYTASINCCKKNHSIATATKSLSLKSFIAKTPLLHMLYFMN